MGFWLSLSVVYLFFGAGMGVAALARDQERDEYGAAVIVAIVLFGALFWPYVLRGAFRETRKTSSSRRFS